MSIVYTFMLGGLYFFCLFVLFFIFLYKENVHTRPERDNAVVIAISMISLSGY